MKDFTISNALERIKNEGDIFKPVLGKGIDLKKVVDSFSDYSSESVPLIPVESVPLYYS